MNYFFSLILSIGIFLPGRSQIFQVEKLSEKNPSFPEDVYVFPVLKGIPSIADKINSTLIKSELDLDYGKQKNSIFENIWKMPGQPMAQVNDLNYKTELLNQNFFSVTVSGEWCSAYCEGFERTYTFDMQTGEKVMLNSFFSAAGQKKILNDLLLSKTLKIQNKIKEIKAALASDSLLAGEKESYDQMLDLYNNCGSNYDSLHYFRFIPSDTGLTIIIEKCSLHANRAIDDLGDFKSYFSFGELEKYLSDYGKKKLKAKEKR